MTISNFVQVAGMFIIPLLAVLIPVLIGQRYGINRSKKLLDAQHSPVAGIVNAAMGLLAFMLAFTFQIAASRYTERKEMLIAEVTNIRTTYLRAGLIPQPFRSGTRKLLVEYVDLRVELAKDISKLDIAKSRSQQMLDTLWDYSEKLAEQDRSSEAYSLYISSVNDLVDNYNQRITVVLEFRIPSSVLYTLFIITFLTMLILGFEIGISGKGNFNFSLMLALIFGIVIFLILALDRPELGITKLNQQPMYTLQQQLNRK